jgi:RNA polymerase primary sigma factor
MDGDIVIDKNGDEVIIDTTQVSCTSLNKKINEEGDELLEVISDDMFDDPDSDILNTELIKNELNKTLEILDDRERRIIELYFGINQECEAMTLEAIGEEYDLTKERVRQIKEKAIRKLRHNVGGLHMLIY